MKEAAVQVVGKLNRKANGVIKGDNIVTFNPPPRRVGGGFRDSHRPVSFVTESEVNKMADAANRERDRLLILVLFQCCLRASEVIQITPKHRQFIDGKPVLGILGKGQKPRLVPMPEALSHRFGDYITRNEVAGNERLFPITRFRALQIIKECGIRAGIDRRIYTHLLRHGGSVARLSKTGNIKSLQLFLGHSDIKMTMRYLTTLQSIQSLEIESGVEFER